MVHLKLIEYICQVCLNKTGKKKKRTVAMKPSTLAAFNTKKHSVKPELKYEMKSEVLRSQKVICRKSRKRAPPVKQIGSKLPNHLCLLLKSHLNEDRIKMSGRKDDSQQEMSKANLRDGK